MAVWLSMDMSYVGAGDNANTSKVAVSVTVHWSSVSYNGYSPPVTVSIDGVSDTEYVSFNTGKTSSGSQNIYYKYWNVGHDSSGSARTVYGSASYDTGTASGTVSASASVSLPAIGESGGGDSGGDSGGDEDTYYQIITSGSGFSVSVTSIGEEGNYPYYKYGTTLKILVSASDGYDIVSCYIDGESTTYKELTMYGDVYVNVETELVPYSLSISEGTGSTVTVTRNGTTLSVNDPIYYNEKLTITFGTETGYSLATHTVNGSEFTSGSSHTVTGNVAIVATATATATLTGTAHIDGAEYTGCIEDGTTWYEYEAYIDNGTTWEVYT